MGMRGWLHFCTDIVDEVDITDFALLGLISGLSPTFDLEGPRPKRTSPLPILGILIIEQLRIGRIVGDINRMGMIVPYIHDLPQRQHSAKPETGDEGGSAGGC
jgi:hypothetical protein